jgi:hypothetical protein
MPAPDLTGAWHLVRWEIAAHGRLSQPFGPGATGMLLYTADGHMQAVIAAAGRAPLSAPVPRQAPQAERAAAFDSYFHYAGSYALIAGPRVVHRVTHALNPAFVGTEQVRDIDLSGDVLTLSAREGPRHHRIIWRR